MKKVIVCILLLSFVAVSAHAAQGQSGNQKGQPQKNERMAYLKNELNLTDEQMKEIRQIRENGGSREEFRAVLTDEQRAKMDKVREQAKNQQAGTSRNTAKHPAQDSQPADPDTD